MTILFENIKGIFLIIKMLQSEKEDIVKKLNEFKKYMNDEESYINDYIQYYNIAKIDEDKVKATVEKLISILDNILKKYKSTKYLLSINYKDSEYPYTIRINKQGKKIITKKQKKLVSILFIK